MECNYRAGDQPGEKFEARFLSGCAQGKDKLAGSQPGTTGGGKKTQKDQYWLAVGWEKRKMLFYPAGYNNQLKTCNMNSTDLHLPVMKGNKAAALSLELHTG